MRRPSQPRVPNTLPLAREWQTGGSASRNEVETQPELAPLHPAARENLRLGDTDERISTPRILSANPPFAEVRTRSDGGWLNLLRFVFPTARRRLLIDRRSHRRGGEANAGMPRESRAPRGDPGRDSWRGKRDDRLSSLGAERRSSRERLSAWEEDRRAAYGRPTNAPSGQFDRRFPVATARPRRLTRASFAPARARPRA